LEQPPAGAPLGPPAGNPVGTPPDGWNAAAGDQIVAYVGGDVVLLSELLPEVEQMLRDNADRIPPAQLNEYRQLLLQKKLQGVIQVRLVLEDLRQRVPPEGLKKIREQFQTTFEEQEVKRLMKQFSVSTRAELTRKLLESGQTLAQYRRRFIDNMLARQWMRQQVEPKEEITHAQMLAYYAEHLQEYEFPAKARWEQLTIYFTSPQKRNESKAQLAQWGNMVLSGVPLAEVARRYSQEPRAQDGGLHDWTSQGSLVSVPLDTAIFSLPVGQLSPIIEDSEGAHIIRVLERKAAGRIEFGEAQAKIKETLKTRQREENYRQFIAKVRQQTKVWTILDNAPSVSRAEDRPGEVPR
jgi:parvulin-like peptidyl-prolyl isomerase